MAGLTSVEIAVILSWTLLANSLLGLLSGGSWLTAPVCWLLSVAILAWLEHTGSTRRLNCPLQAFGLDLITLDGARPGQWRIFLRHLLLTPLVLLFGAAFLRLRRRDCNLLQFLSGTRIVPLDSSMDPRIPAEVHRDRRLAMRRVLGYMFSSVAVAAIILLIPHGSAQAFRRPGTVEHGLPPEEQELLGEYLRMAALYPDSIEFHVRLASLYYRNGMETDLETELDAIRRIDPEHPMLLLGEDLSVDYSDISVDPAIGPGQDSVPGADTSAVADSSLSTADSASTADSLPAPDSLPEIRSSDVETAPPPPDPELGDSGDAPQPPPVDGAGDAGMEPEAAESSPGDGAAAPEGGGAAPPAGSVESSPDVAPPAG